MPRGQPIFDSYGIYPTRREVDPTRVANLMIDRGAAACAERWHWLNQHAISDLATEGRCLIATGRKWGGPRPAARRGPRPGKEKSNR